MTATLKFFVLQTFFFLTSVTHVKEMPAIIGGMQPLEK